MAVQLAASTLDPGLAALLGAGVGGLTTLLVAWLTARQAQKKDARTKRDYIAASAILLQDDFWHYEATLARSLDRDQWWDRPWLLHPQTTTDDLKQIYAALNNKDMMVVANAQGWMDYLRHCVRKSSAR